MKDEFNYISDQDLEQLIHQVEQEELVAAPPNLMEEILRKLEAEQPSEKAVQKVVLTKSPSARKKEFYAYCFRVITSVAAAVALVFLLPEMSTLTRQAELVQEVYEQEIPRLEEVADTVPAREEVVSTKQTPTKDEVLNDAGFIERVLNNTGWWKKQQKED